MNPGTVSVAFLHPGHYAACFAESLQNVLFYDLFGPDGDGGANRVVPHGMKMGKQVGANSIVAGRNALTKAFLEETDTELLWWIDSDMGFDDAILEELIAVADPDERPVVGALCFALKTAGKGPSYAVRYRMTPTLYEWVERDDEVGFASIEDYPRDQLVEVSATGAACLLIHRTVAERVRERHGDNWFTPVTHPTNSTTFGEDLSFSVRLASLDVPIHVHTGIKTTHDKGSGFLDEETFDRQRQLERSDRTAVIVPVLGRPEHAQRFMDSYRRSGAVGAVYAVCSDEDSEPWTAAGATVVKVDTISFSSKVNAAYRATTEPWLCLVGSDVQFHSGWQQEALQVGRWASVIGTNDLGNPRVLAGTHATHMLIRRAYIDAQGASWDGPGIVCHEGYRHWYVDDEIVTVAKQRGEWAMASGAVIEHLHPAWGKGDMDDVYELGDSSSEEDRELFIRRVEAHNVRAA